jgi:hypothetical protein
MSTLLEQASLVLIPSGYKEDTVFSAIPTDGSGDLSFTRASNGTRINSAGLVEVVAWNLLEQSETFDNGVWAKESGNSVTANTTTAPNGTTTADTLSATATNTINTYQVYAITAGVYTYSVYVKKKSTNIISTYIYQTGVGFAAIGEINFDNETFTNGTIESVGDGWFRVALSATLTTQTHTFGFYTSSTTGTRDVYIWGAQTNIGSTAKPYFPTTDRLNVPRLTYQNGGGGCPSLLLEKQSTNLALYSEQFDNAAWGTFRSSISANNTTSPDGTQNADKIIQQASTTDSGGIYQNLSLSNSTVYTYSVYLKAAGYNFGLVRVDGGQYAWFDLSNGVVGSITGSGSSSIQNMGNGWYRCIFTFTTTSTLGEPHIYVAQTNGSAIVSSADGVKGIFAWGAQAEASSYPTSYIPTTSASATRVADACYKTGISSLIGQTEGTLFVDLVWNNPIEDVVPLDITGSDGKLIWMRGIGAQFYGNGTTLIVNIGVNGAVQGTRYKIAFLYGANDFKLYRNGALIGTDTSGTFTGSFSDIALNAVINQSNLFNQVVLFKTKLTDAELIALTTI